MTDYDFGTPEYWREQEEHNRERYRQEDIRRIADRVWNGCPDVRISHNELDTLVAFMLDEGIIS